MHYLRLLNIIVAFGAVFGVNTVLAVELVASATQELELTDNAHSTVDNKAKEATSNTTVTAGLTHKSSTLDLSINYAVAHVRYHKDQFDNTNNVVGNGNATWYIVPGRLNWFVSETENYSIVDRRLADTADNRAQSSSLSTGPRVAIPITPVDSATFDAVYTKSATDNDNGNDNGSVVTSGSVGWSHLLSQTRSFSIDYSQSNTNFDDNDNDNDNDNDFESDSISGTINIDTASGAFLIGMGRTRLDRDVGSTTDSNTFDLQYTLGFSRSVLALSARKELTDTVTVSTLTLSAAGREFSQSFQNEDSVIRSTFDASFNTPIWGEVTLLGLSSSFQKEEFQANNDVQRIKSLNVEISHNLTQSISLFTTYNYQWLQFDTVATKRIDREHTLSLGGGYDLSNELSVNLGVSRELRQVGSEGPVDHASIKKNSLDMSVTYQFL